MTKSNAKKKMQDPRGKRFTQEQRREALRLVASGLRRGEVARIVGTTLESLRRWSRAAEKTAKATKEKSARRSAAKASAADPAPVSVRSSDGGLAPIEVSAILEEKKAHPSMGPAQIRAQLKRFRGWRLSTKAIARVLRANGYRLVHKGARPEGDEHPGRFEAPRRNAIWQLDFCEVRVGAERCFLLFVLDSCEAPRNVE